MSIMDNVAAERLWLHTQAHLNEKADKKAVKEQLENILQDVPQIVKNSFPGGVGYEEETEVYGDTLTWDGDVGGHDVVGNDIFTFCRVSDAVPTMEDFAKGGQIVFKNPDGAEEVLGFDDLNDYGLGWIQSGYFVVIQQDNLTTLGYTWKKTGVYFMKTDDGGIAHTASLTISGYNGFKTVTSVVNPIDPKYLPDHLPSENPVEILPETTFTMDFNNGYFDLRGMFTGVYSKGDVCTVIFDSIEYECTAYIKDSEMSYTALGGFDQSYPFFVYSHYVQVQDEQQHTIRIINRNVKKLDNKFLDINITDNIIDAEDDDVPTVKAVMDELNGFAGWVDSELSKIPALPEITSADNGKVLMVVNGKLQLVSLNLSVDANGVITVQ